MPRIPRLNEADFPRSPDRSTKLIMTRTIGIGLIVFGLVLLSPSVLLGWLYLTSSTVGMGQTSLWVRIGPACGLGLIALGILSVRWPRE
jgi:hypothetical protein